MPGVPDGNRGNKNILFVAGNAARARNTEWKPG